MINKLLLTLVLLVYLCAAQGQSQQKLSVGIEQDILPYITGGYFAGAWVGRDHVRARGVLAHVHKPDFITPNGFTNNQVTAYAILLDYFHKREWSGWWGGAGVVYWDSRIQRTTGGNTVYYSNVLLNGSVGYQWKFYRHFYLCPWAGLHLRVAGDTEVTVDGDSFTTPVFNPEASLKVGWYF